MKKLFLLICFSISYLMHCQPSDSTYIMSEKKRSLINETLFLTKLDNETLLYEYHSNGMDVYWGFKRDTLKFTNGIYQSADHKVEFLKNDKFKVTTENFTRTYKYEDLSIADPAISIARNTSYREELKYKIKDANKENDFVAQTDNLIQELDFEDFKVKAKEILENLGVIINYKISLKN